MSITPWIFGKGSDRHFGVEAEGEKLTVTEALVQGSLDWDVESRLAKTDDEDAIPATGYRQIVRVDDLTTDPNKVVPKDATIRETSYMGEEAKKAYYTLGMVKGRYKIVPNAEAFTFFDNATFEGAAIIRAVGHLDFGRMVWAVAERPHTVALFPGDEIVSTLILATSHDGTSSLTASFIPHRKSSGAVLDIFGRQKAIRIRHTKSANEKLKEAHLLLSKDVAFWNEWRARLLGEQDGCYQHGKDRKPALAKKIITTDDVQRVVKALLPAKRKKQEDGSVIETVPTRTKNARDMLEERFEQQVEERKAAQAEAGEPIEGPTALDLFLGAAEYVNEDRLVKNKGNKWVASTFGTGSDFRKKAYNLIAGL